MNSILFSTANVVGPKTPWFLKIGINEIVRRALYAGYDGIELFPIRFRISNQMLNGLEDIVLNYKIASLHQSFRSEKTIKNALSHPSPHVALFAYFALPQLHDSLEHLINAQRVLGRLPSVIYPPKPGESYPELQKLSNCIVQPAPYLMEEWSVDTVEEFSIAAEARSFGICLDTMHIRRNENGYGFGDWKYAIEVLLPQIRLVHVQFKLSAGISKQGDQSLKESDIDTTLAMVKHLKSLGYAGDFTIEMPATDMPGFFISKEALFSNHMLIVDLIREIL